MKGKSRTGWGAFHVPIPSHTGGIWSRQHWHNASTVWPGLAFPPAAAFAGLSSTPSPGLLAHFAHCSLCFLLLRLYLWPHCEKLSQIRPCFPSPCPSLLLQCSKIPTPVARVWELASQFTPQLMQLLTATQLSKKPTIVL